MRPFTRKNQEAMTQGNISTVQSSEKLRTLFLGVNYSSPLLMVTHSAAWLSKNSANWARVGLAAWRT